MGAESVAWVMDTSTFTHFGRAGHHDLIGSLPVRSTGDSSRFSTTVRQFPSPTCGTYLRTIPCGSSSRPTRSCSNAIGYERPLSSTIFSPRVCVYRSALVRASCSGHTRTGCCPELGGRAADEDPAPRHPMSPAHFGRIVSPTSLIDHAAVTAGADLPDRGGLRAGSVGAPRHLQATSS